MDYLAEQPDGDFPVPQIEFNPRHYLCYRIEYPIDVDGVLSDSAWELVDWTENFVDIQGDSMPEPVFATRVKMLWDDSYFYVGALLEEDHIWATLTKRDAVIYHDNDFEVFIDPDGDTHNYYELEVNALNTVWDLLLIEPYRDGGPAVDAWDIQGLKTAVSLDGTLNDPTDLDENWTVEIAIPWEVLKQAAGCQTPPVDGDQWRINFSRVEWQSEVKDSTYTKKIDPSTGKTYPENNWVWSPQGLIKMHYPEMWGIVQFSEVPAGLSEDVFRLSPVHKLKWYLRQVYYHQRWYRERFGKYTENIHQLGLGHLDPENVIWPPLLEATPDLYQASLSSIDSSYMVMITQDGRVWKK